MNRNIELALILSAIVLLSLWISSTETYADYLTSLGSKYSTSGVVNVSGCSSNPTKSILELIPNFNDLLQSGLLSGEMTDGLASSDNILARTCGDDNSSKSGLLANIGSNTGRDCSLILDMQKYSLRSRVVELVVDLAKSNDTQLVILNNKTFAEFVLLKPLFITLGNSWPFTLETLGTGVFVYSTCGVTGVSRYDEYPREEVTVRVKPLDANAKRIFPSLQQRNLSAVIKEKMNNVETAIGLGNGTSIPLTFVVYYLDIENQVGNAIQIPEGTTTARMDSNDYFKTTLATLKTRGDIGNPAFTVKFNFFVTSTQQEQQKDNWVYLVSVGSQGWGDCSINGRGILLAELRPKYARTAKSWMGIAEYKGYQPDYVCIDFTNVEHITNNRSVVNGCGDPSRLSLYVPTDVEVEICYMVSTSFKTVVASWYNADKRKREITYAHYYNCNNWVNAVKQTVEQVGDLSINNLCKKSGQNPSSLRVSNVSIMYGMENLHKWFSSVSL